MNRKGIAIGGNLVLDNLKIVDIYPNKGNLANILDVQRSVGGAVPNCLIDLAKIDDKTPLTAIGLVGCDEAGDFIIQQLNNYNINTDFITRDSNQNTSYTDVMSVSTDGSRTFFTYRGANSLLDIEHFDLPNLNADILHIGYALLLDKLDSKDNEYGTVMARLLHMAQEQGIKTSVDVVSEDSDRFRKIVPPSLKYTNYCIINEVEASYITNIPARGKNESLIVDNMQKMCKELFKMGVKDWAIIHSPEGGFGMNDKGDYYIQPSLKLPEGYIKGTTGAGDAFCAGILYSVYKEWDIEKALKIAVSAAACNLSEVNAVDGMKDIDSIQKLYNSMPKRELK
ncbi:MAG: carbohydrate kinase family protein [Clostridia bacterium]|nr:carbohydrate kinase family protein [Clostridia bacterium]